MTNSRRGVPEYINHLGRAKLTPTTWVTFLEDIGPTTLRLHPFEGQQGDECFAFASKIAISLQTGRNPSVAQYRDWDGGCIIQAAITLKGHFIDHSKSIGVTDSIDRVLCRSLVDPVIRRLITLLRQGYLVIAIQNCGGPVWMGDHFQFTSQHSQGAHAVCLVGVYEDHVLGTCFVSKMSRRALQQGVDGLQPVTGKTVEICGEMMPLELCSFALLPVRWLCSTVYDIGNTKARSIDTVLLYPLSLGY